MTFDKAYYANEVITFDFSFHQEYMYTLDSSYCTYSFTPGWFDEIAVKDIQVYWNQNNVYSSTAQETNSDNYLVWSGRLAKGAKLKTEVKYPKSAFKKLDTSKQYVEETYSKSSSSSSPYTLCIMALIVVAVLSILTSFSGGGYYSHSGYGYGYGYGHPHIHSHSHSHYGSSCASSSSCVSSCACACACAGGGRAGCSKKDFYGTNLRTNNLNKILNKK